MTRSNTTLLAALCLFLLISCDRPACKNENPVFDRHQPQEKMYKDELARQLKLVDPSKLSYWVKGYRERNSVQYIHANVQGDDLCAEMVITVKGSHNGIEGILQSRGGGYHGAELKGLKFDVNQHSSDTEFIFKTVNAIID